MNRSNVDHQRNGVLHRHPPPGKRQSPACNLLELVRLRVAQIHGRPDSMKIHRDILRTRGEADDRLLQVDTWERSRLFNARERSALAFCEKITRDSGASLPEGLVKDMLRHFTKDEIVSIALAVMSVNEWSNNTQSAAAHVGRVRVE